MIVIVTVFNISSCRTWAWTRQTLGSAIWPWSQTSSSASERRWAIRTRWSSWTCPTPPTPSGDPFLLTAPSWTPPARSSLWKVRACIVRPTATHPDSPTTHYYSKWEILCCCEKKTCAGIIYGFIPSAEFWIVQIPRMKCVPSSYIISHLLVLLRECHGLAMTNALMTLWICRVHSDLLPECTKLVVQIDFLCLI